MTGPRVAVAMFTALPVPRSWHALSGAGRAAKWLPAVGAVLGALAGLPAALAAHRGLPLLGAVLAVAALAVLTGGLHLDGLADTADGLGSRADAARALEIMRRSDIGPFGVVALVSVLLVDVASLTSVGGIWRPLAALAVAGATGRLAVVHSCLPGIRPARDAGFGALVAGRTTPVLAAVLSLAVLGGGAGAAWLAAASPVRWVLAQAGALVLAGLLCRHAVRRLGGVTGDVFGALVETATAACLALIALTH
jgi:adenosylcobinamide-GDP ribazoletransferase